MPTLCLSQPVVRLVVKDRVQPLVYLLRGRFQLRQDGRVLLDPGQRCLLAHLEVHIDDFVREGGKLVAETGDIDTGGLQCSGERRRVLENAAHEKKPTREERKS